MRSLAYIFFYFEHLSSRGVIIVKIIHYVFLHVKFVKKNKNIDIAVC